MNHKTIILSLRLHNKSQQWTTKIILITSPTHYANFASLIWFVHRGIKTTYKIIFKTLKKITDWLMYFGRLWIVSWPVFGNIDRESSLKLCSGRSTITVPIGKSCMWNWCGSCKFVYKLYVSRTTKCFMMSMKILFHATLVFNKNIWMTDGKKFQNRIEILFDWVEIFWYCRSLRFYYNF